MKDYYKILGVTETASADEIKKAYRKLANQHHPDKGGDQNKFKEISVAYDTLGDEQKRSEYDHQRKFGNQQHQFRSHQFQDVNDIFTQAFGGSPFEHVFGQRQRKNRDLNISCQINLLESFTGKQLEANYTLPSGRNQSVVINIPPGVDHGATIRYQGLGDDSIPGLIRGNLNVTIIVVGDPQGKFSRRGDDLRTFVEISPIEAMIGCKKRAHTITNQSFEFDIRPGIEHGTEFAMAGQGFTNSHNGQKGRFVVEVRIKSKAITDPQLVEKLRQLHAEISSKP